MTPETLIVPFTLPTDSIALLMCEEFIAWDDKNLKLFDEFLNETVWKVKHGVIFVLKIHPFD